MAHRFSEHAGQEERQKRNTKLMWWAALLGENCIHPSCIGSACGFEVRAEACLLPEMLPVVVSQYK